MVVCIDGPSGAGKSSAARLLAARLGFAYLDTGALYRSLGLGVRLEGVNPDDRAAVERWLAGADVEVRLAGGRFLVLYGGQDAEPFIRGEEMGELASKLSAQPAVRAHLLGLQRSAALSGDLVCEGRDMGTVVFPSAEVKFFLTASSTERAGRRYAEMRESDPSLTLEKVMADMARRDGRDSSRAAAPLAAAPDAETLDTTLMSLEQVVEHMVRRVRRLIPTA